MAEEEVAAAATSPSPADLKRKHPESEVAEPLTLQKEDEETVDAKRPRFDEEEEEENPHSLVTENGSQEDKTTEPKEEEEPSEKNNTKTETPQQTTDEAPEDIQKTTEEAPEGVENEKPATDDQQVGDIQPLVGENPQSENENQQPSETEAMEPSAEATRQVDGSFVGDQPASETEGISRKMDVPNDKVGVLIGKGGETIRYLQINSGAKIQIMRDADVDPQSTNRPVELIGGLENINKAEKLIKDVIAEADAGGSPALVARGFTTAQAAGAVEQVLIQVPNEKVGVIIGKGGDTIKNLQTRSGARIQLIPQHLPDGDQSKERTVRVSGDKKQIERAREMIREVMSQPPRQSSSGGYNQQQQPFRPRGPSSQQQWGSRGPNPSHPTGGYDYPQRGPYPSQNSQFQQHPHGYNNYPPQSGLRGNYGPSWGDQRPHTMQGGGYDYYNAPSSGPHSQAHGPGPNMGPPPQGNYNYNQPGSYHPPSQGYSHGYPETKYENQAHHHHPQQQPYGKPPPQNYGPPRGTQPSDIPPPQQQPYVQNTAPPQQQPYGQNTVPPQQQPYGQNYPSYGPAEGYNINNNQAQPVPGSAPMYPQQSGQVAGYGSYPAQQQQNYVGDQSSAQNNAAMYGYQAGSDPSAYGGPPAGQAGYAQQVPAQQGYDQSVPNPSVYGAVPAGYGKGVSPQPGYDATQMYGAAPAPAPR